MSGVSVPQEMAEAMTPDKSAAISADERNLVLQRIAKACKRQGNYHLACKKYTQAGEKIKVGGCVNCVCVCELCACVCLCLCLCVSVCVCVLIVSECV